MADYVHNLDAATAFLGEKWDLAARPFVSRFGGFAEHITRSTSFAGGKLYRKLYYQGFSRAQATDSLESAYPAPGKVDVLDVNIDESHLRRLGVSMIRSIPATYEVDPANADNAVFDLATELAAEGIVAMYEKKCLMMHITNTMVMGTVAAKYKADGDTYSQATTAFLQVTDAPVTRFKIGMILAPHATQVEVKDIILTTNWGNGRTNGPGIVVQLYTAEAEGDTHLDDLAAADVLRVYGDSATGGFDLSLPTLTSPDTGSALPYFSIADRRAVGRKFLMCEGGALTSTTLDIDTHIGAAATVLADVTPKARLQRARNQPKAPSALLLVCRPDLAEEIARQCGDASLRFQRKDYAGTDEARNANLVAVRGWTGAVLTSLSFYPMAVEVDNLCAPNTIYIVDPQAYEWITLGPDRPKFDTSGGQTWFPVLDTSTGRRLPKVEATALQFLVPWCDNPKAAAYKIATVTAA